jgi:hypothetical protein
MESPGEFNKKSPMNTTKKARKPPVRTPPSSAREAQGKVKKPVMPLNAYAIITYETHVLPALREKLHKRGKAVGGRTRKNRTRSRHQIPRA